MEFSVFLNHEESFFEFNTNILETNLINILILLGLLLYGYKTSFSGTLKERQTEIIQTIENAQKDFLNASNYYYFAEKGFSQSLFWLQYWKALYQKEKEEVVKTKYIAVKELITETFLVTETLIKNFETKSFLSLQRYIIFLVAGKILRKFFFLSEKEQAKVLEITISKLGGNNK
jgi:F-type H+-transporting ATPase subunit b